MLAVPKPLARLRTQLQVRRETRLAYLLTLPSLILMIGLIGFPVLYALWISLHRVSFLSPGQPFIGLGNYLALLRNSDFWFSIQRTGYFTVVSLVVQTATGLGIAVVLNERFPGRTLLRGLILLPWAIPTVVNGVLWLWILDGSTGALNGLLKQIGFIERNVIWLGRPLLAMNGVILADSWRMIPLYAIMFLAGLQTIPDDLYDAAKVDGAGVWARFRYITLPYLRPVILVVLVLRTLQTFRVFNIIYIMTKGGPANSTMVIAYLTYLNSFKFQNFGYGAALAFVIALTTLALALVYIRLLSPETEA